MYYLVIVLSMAASVAASDIISEVSSEYFAHYVVENDPADIGINEPAAATRTAQVSNSPAAQAGWTASGKCVPADGGSAEARASVGPVTQVLFAGLAAASSSSAAAAAPATPLAAAEPSPPTRAGARSMRPIQV